MEQQETREIHTSQSSVEISINAKGQWSGKIKVYADSIEDAQSNALTKASELESKILAKNAL